MGTYKYALGHHDSIININTIKLNPAIHRATMHQSLVLTTLLAAASRALPQQPRANKARGITTSASHVSNKTFDYIVCGGGLTGLAVASRLSEDPNISVLVIEGGNDDHEDPRINDVRTYGEAFESDLDYNLTSSPVPWQNGSSLPLVAGKTLGGSGSLNGGSWTKGDKTQYDLLPVLTGDDSWSFDALNEIMLGAEEFHEPTQEQIEKGAQYEDEFHGRQGPVQVSFPAGMFRGIQLPALEASSLVWKGLKRVADFAAGVTNGATIIPDMVQADGSQNRSSPFTVYAEKQTQERSNFLILTGHRVTSINWRNGTKIVADGVSFQACRDGEVFTAKTKREVLLAAGSLQSPQLLELSGVGDAEILAAAGVPLKLSSPNVGKNMQEQTKNTLWFDPVSTDFDGSGPPNAISFPNVDQLFKHNSASMYESIISGLVEYAQNLSAAGIVTNATATHQILEAQVNNLWHNSVGAAEIFFVTSSATGQVGIDLWNLIVLSRGYVHITSNSSWDHPAIEPSYFGHQFDLDVQLAAAKQSRGVFQTEPLASLVRRETSPGLDVVPQNATDDVWEQWVKATFTSVWHYIATLGMMKEELGGVVDSRLKVYGIENVRAVDASVLPIQLSAHLSSSLYGIAEKAAIMIKEDQCD
jgi:choline dehydrogenase